ncbi:hypothetical protein ACHAXN_006280 [Cyclotella atomus]
MTSPSSHWKDKPRGGTGLSIPKLLALLVLGGSRVQAAGRLRAIANQVVSVLPNSFVTHRALSANACVPADVRTIKIESTTGHQIQMFEFKAFTPSGEEVAGSKVATQSSTYRSLPKFAASNAVDGNESSFSHTDGLNPFWEVDLGQDFSISSVEIKNRWCVSASDPLRCLCRMSAATISLIDAQGSLVKSLGMGDTCETLLLQYLSAPTQSPVQSPSNTSSTCSVKKLKLESTTTINMFELEVYDSSGINIARQGIASQSSTYNNADRFSASKAIDGQSSTFSHTDNDGSSYWSLDLNGLHDIERVLIRNRFCGNPSDPKNCLCRLSAATLTLYDEQDSVVASRDIGDTCGKLSIEELFGASCLSPATPPRCSASASKIRLESTTGEHLQMFEFQAFAASQNVAFQGSASQSSLLGGNLQFAASNAIDANPKTFSHTGDSQAFWELDLNGPKEIESVVILNRFCKSKNDPNGCLCRMSSAVLTLFDQDGSITAQRTIGDTCNVLTIAESFTSCPLVSTSPTKNPTNAPDTITVKIEANSGFPLKLYEVKVFSDGSNKAVLQDSVSSASGSATNSSLAHDDNTITFFYANGTSSWWQIVLAGPGMFVNKVAIYSDRSCDLSGAAITLWDASGNRVAKRTIGSSCNKYIIDEFFMPGCTENPTSSPSTSPSALPSSTPSIMPSETPSAMPSDSPSESLSNSPSDVPSESPSSSPSSLPSASPSSEPSLSPSSSPTESPSALPSSTPSIMPSETPSAMPSDNPSESPSNSPSDVPSELPSSSPSHSPSESPSISPSSSPTLTCYEKVKYVTLTSTSGNFKVYELRVHSTAGTNAALNQPTNFISGNEDTGNPSRNAVDSNIDTYAATTSGDGTLEVTLETGIELLSFEIVLRDSSHLYNGTLELLDASRKSVVRHTIPAQSKTIFYYQENAKCPTDPPSASPSTSPTVSPTLSPTPNPTVSPSSSPSTSPSHSPSTSPSVSPTSSSPTSRPTVSPSASPTLTCYNDARTVRIESTTSQQIGFYEVIVTSSGVNKSPVGNATQSSTNGANVAVNAIDDNIDVYSLTAANDLNAYWQVELDSDYYVNDVIIANLYCGGLPSADAANGNCTCRLSGAVIKLLDSSNLLIVERALGNTCGQTILMEVFEENPNCRTMSPSTSPSTSPSKNPTKVPTRQPSKNPTKQPSQNPTKQPSKNPTKQPSKNPTQQPSKFPTAAPTKQPSKNPTQQPSKFPTTAPTKQPSKKPTKQPSKNPTSAPTKQPSKNPTKSPSTSPTAAPSSSPTSSPTLTCFNNIDQVRIKSTTGDRISVREVEVYSQGINRAANGTATQSSVDSSDPSAIATSAIDENVVSYSSTNNETGAYLLIDLRGTFDITSVTIRNRYCSNLLEGDYDSCKCYLSFATIEFIGNGVVVATRAVSNSCTLSDVTETLSSNDRCYPSQSPSLSRSPSESPSTTPSMRPSDSPSLSPSLSLMPTESAVINITITGSTTLTPTSRRRLVLYTIGNLSEDQSNDFIASAKATIEAVVCTGFEICEVRIPDIQLIGSSYVISFIIAVPKVCSTYDCSDSSVLLSQVNQTSTAALQEAVTNGSLVTTLVQEMTIPTMKALVQGTSATYVMDVVSIEYSPTHPRFPSTTPSQSPSISTKPSANPSLSPSVASSDAPSVNPSLSPSVASSDAPSTSPSANPSLSPSVASSDAPSASPAPTECPDPFSAGITYEEGDMVEKNGIVYQCKTAPNSQWCSTSGYEPGSDQSDTAWGVVGYCTGSIAPTKSPSKISNASGCPSAFSSSAKYEAGDKVSVGSGAGSAIVYECAASPNDVYCNQYEPGNSLKLGWEVRGYCDGTYSPNQTPAFQCVVDSERPGDIFPVCPGMADGQYCDGDGDCGSSFCACDAGSAFCDSQSNPCFETHSPTVQTSTYSPTVQKSSYNPTVLTTTYSPTVQTSTYIPTFQNSSPDLFTLGTDRTNKCPGGYVNIANEYDCFQGYQYLASTDSSKTWVLRAGPRSWSSSLDNPGCVVYLYNGSWDFFYNTGGQLPGAQSNRFPVCSLSEV